MRRRLRSAAFPLHRHSIPQLAIDGALVAAAYYLSYRLRFDTGTPKRYEALFDSTIVFVVVSALIVFTLFRLELKQWRYTSSRDYLGIFQAVLVNTLVLAGFIAVTHPVTVRSGAGEITISAPTGVIALFFLLTLVLVGGARFVARIVYEGPVRGFRARADARRVLIVGAGEGGRLVLREVLRNPQLGLDPVGFVDDDPLKRGIRVDGVKVLGPTDQLGRILDEAEPDEITIAIPSAPGTLRARVVRAARQRGIPVRTLPTVFELLQAGSGQVVRQVREVQVEDILGREPVRMELDRVGGYLGTEVVMITGAGGSIGAELCRQIARVAPRRLILVDHAEENLFRIQRELEDDRHVHPSTIAPVLADCKEGERMREVLAEHRPGVVFHAAAYKHVGLMERNPVEAVRNNALATRLVARGAGGGGAQRQKPPGPPARPPRRGRGGRQALRARLHRQGRAARDGDGGLQGAGRVRRRGRPAALAGDEVRHRALRQRPGLLGLGGADLPAPDRARRPGHGDRRAHDALLHDHPGGRAARHPRRLAGRGRRALRPADGRPRLDHAARPRHDRALGTGPGARHRHRGGRSPARREAARGPVQPLRATQAHPRRQDHARAPRSARSRRRGIDVRRDRPARARGRRGRPGGQGRRALGRPPSGPGDG